MYKPRVGWEVEDFWGSIFTKIGCRQIKRDILVYETQELVAVLSLKFDDTKKDFYIDVGILIRKLHSDSRTLTTPVPEDADIWQSLYCLLLNMGEWEYYLNNLFCYDPKINFIHDIIINTIEIANLFGSKIIPYLHELDNYAWVANDFEEKTTWIPFLKRFRASEVHNKHFGGALDEYYRHNRI